MPSVSQVLIKMTLLAKHLVMPLEPSPHKYKADISTSGSFLPFGAPLFVPFCPSGLAVWRVRTGSRAPPAPLAFCSLLPFNNHFGHFVLVTALGPCASLGAFFLSPKYTDSSPYHLRKNQGKILTTHLYHHYPSPSLLPLGRR